MRFSLLKNDNQYEGSHRGKLVPLPDKQIFRKEQQDLARLYSTQT